MSFLFFDFFSSRGRSHRTSHPRSSNYCVCDGLVARIFFWCTYTARTFRTFLCVLHTCMAQGCLQCACRYLSFISPSPFSWFTRLCSCCSLTVTSRPLPTTTSTTSLTIPSTPSCRTFQNDLKALVKRTPPEDELFGYLAKFLPLTSRQGRHC